ncbi:MAG: DUF853 domain-containing protein [Oscillospiraceae bacterium]|nr:DUF853 domain-containing protein [Oscillospiraceae bacterium]
MYLNQEIYLGLAGERRVTMAPGMANRHGLIAGASGTGKTVTMKVLAESFSDAGVPVFLCDIKGDVSGLAEPGVSSAGMEKRIDKFGLREVFAYRPYPVCFWDVYQTEGHPVRATVSDMGPELLARILQLSPAQEGVLNIVFRVADDRGLLLIDLKDLRALLGWVGDHREELLSQYGNVSSQSLGGIVRALLPLEAQGGELFFGEPDLDILDLIRCDSAGRGIVNLLDCVQLARSPKLYATFLLWLMSELFERLPERGDADKPKLVFFFDEAHMLFSDAPKLLVQKIEQMVKLIRSKGVGVWFVTQSPGDIPDSVLAQLSGRIQHALRAYTPAEQKAVRAAANSMRPNPEFKTEEAILELGVGEALVSLLDEQGVPGVTQRTAIICPQSLMAPCAQETRRAAMAEDGMVRYDALVDRDSAYELLERQRAVDAERAALEAERAALEKEKAALEARQRKEEAAAEKQRQREEEHRKAAAERKAQQRRDRIERQLVNTGTQILKRGLMNTLFGGRR